MSSFGEVLEQLAGGQVYGDLGDRLTEIVQAVQDTRRIGELTLKLKVKPNGESGVIIADEVKSKVPERPRGETIFFTTSAGHLMRNDPRQQDLPLRQVNASTNAPLRMVLEHDEVVPAEIMQGAAS